MNVPYYPLFSANMNTSGVIISTYMYKYVSSYSQGKVRTICTRVWNQVDLDPFACDDNVSYVISTFKKCALKAMQDLWERHAAILPKSHFI